MGKETLERLETMDRTPAKVRHSSILADDEKEMVRICALLYGQGVRFDASKFHSGEGTWIIELDD